MTASTATTAVHDPLAAIPVAPDNVHADLSVPERVRLRWHNPPRTRLGAWLARALGWQRGAVLELDARGSCFWRGIDGQRTLHAIAADLRTTFGLEQAATEQAVIEFTATLMRRGVLCLRLPQYETAETGRNSE